MSLEKLSDQKREYKAPSKCEFPIAQWSGNLSSDRKQRECTVCLERKGPSAFRQHITSKCKHRGDVCLQCVRRAIKVGIDTMGWDRILCPATVYPEIFEYKDVKTHLPTKDFVRQVPFSSCLFGDG